MPIRFRCPTCTGLMSIASRKANSVVACPKCGEQVIVPATEPAGVAVGAANGAVELNAADRPLFERPDFDSLLTKAGVAPAPTPARPVSLPAPPRDPEPASITLSYPAAAMLGAACAGLVAVSFAAGYLLK